MKVGILTFHNAYNYGAILQTYATQELIKGLGHDVEVIDYHNKKIDTIYNGKKFNFCSLARYFYRFPLYFIEIFFYRMRRKAYHTFVRKNIRMSYSRYLQDNTTSIKGYDAILIGSDQLWNKGITGGFDSVYWGDFVSDTLTRKIAWSICMNNDAFSCEEKDYIVKHLNNFSAISVREKSLQVFLKELTQKEYPQTLDPTLLLSRQQWEYLCKPINESNYIAVYAVQNEEEAIQFARQIAKDMKKEIVVLRANSKYYFSKENKEYCGPDEFLSYIRYADFVVTTSFHGTTFSIIFQKQFVCPIFRKNKRIESLLSLVGLGERMIHTSSEVLNLSKIDFNKVEILLGQERAASRQFLDSALINNMN